jgi:drug/metabolite transporter (DMT)-like permease
MLAATFTFAFQNVVAKRVERRVPPMEVVFVRSCISGAVTVFTTWRRVVECNAIVRKTNATDPDAPLDAPPAVPGEDFRDDVFTSETLLGSGRFWALCFLRGVAGSIAFSLAYISLTYLTVGDSVAIFFLNPIFSSLIAIPVLGEKPTLVQGKFIFIFVRAIGLTSCFIYSRSNRRRATRHLAHSQTPRAVSRVGGTHGR